MSDLNDLKQTFEAYNDTVIQYKNNNDNKINQLTQQMENINKMLNRHQLTSKSNYDLETQHSEQFFNIKNNKFNYHNHVEMYNNYCKAFNNYLRYSSDKHGEGLNELEKKSLGIGAATEGGYYLPIGMFENILNQVETISPFRKISSIVQIGGDRLKLPKENLFTAAKWINDENNDETCSSRHTETEISLHEHFTCPKVSQIHLDDPQFPIDKWLIQQISTSFAHSENYAFILGDGIKQPRGILTYAITDDSGQCRASSKLQCINCCKDSQQKLTEEILTQTILSLESGYRHGACWIMNRKTLDYVRSLRDKSNSPIWNFDNHTTLTVLGYPVYEMECMPDLCSTTRCECTENCCNDEDCCDACCYPIIFGNFKIGYQIIDQGIKILRDPYSCKPWVMFYVTKRIGGDVINNDAIKLIKCCKAAS